MAHDAHDHATYCGAPITDIDVDRRAGRSKAGRSYCCPDCLEALTRDC